MKKLFFVTAIALLVIGTAAAQGWGVPNEQVKVDGTLQLQNGQIILSGGGTTVYYVPMIGALVGFVDGLKEGARVSVEGYAFGNILQPSKLTVGGKTYDFPAYANSAGGFGYCGYGIGYCGRYGMMGGGFGRYHRGW